MGRVQKLGSLNEQMLLEAMLQPKSVEIGQYQWTFTDMLDKTLDRAPFFYCRMSKYAKEGFVKVVDTDTKSQRDEIAKNLLIASSPVVYLPDFSGIAYLHVWNVIEESVFRRRFSTLIEARYDNFFVSCEIEPISDYRAFAAKLSLLKRISEIRARVYPPNPLFGDLWKNLNDYIKNREASEILIAEKSDAPKGLLTEINDVIDLIIKEGIKNLEKKLSLTDAAILMAADGYGSGKVVGEAGDESVIIRTSDTQKSFLFSKEPVPEELAAEVRRRFTLISEERNMQH